MGIERYFVSKLLNNITRLSIDDVYQMHLQFKNIFIYFSSMPTCYEQIEKNTRANISFIFGKASSRLYTFLQHDYQYPKKREETVRKYYIKPKIFTS